MLGRDGCLVLNTVSSDTIHKDAVKQPHAKLHLDQSSKSFVRVSRIIETGSKDQAKPTKSRETTGR